MNRKKIHKILIKMGIILCIVGQLTFQISMMAKGAILVKSLPINPFGTIPKCKVECRVKSNDVVNTKQSVIVSKDNKNVKLMTRAQAGNISMLTGKVGGQYAIHGWYQDRLNNLAKGYGKKINIYSGYRSVELQRQLFNNSDKSGKMVAEAGKSRHQVGLAVDVDGWVVNLNNKQLEEYGLYKPMSYENWHIEPIETKGKSTQQLIDHYGTPFDKQVEPGESVNIFKDLIKLAVDKEITRIDKLSSNNK